MDNYACITIVLRIALFSYYIYQHVVDGKLTTFHDENAIGLKHSIYGLQRTDQNENYQEEGTDQKVGKEGAQQGEEKIKSVGYWLKGYAGLQGKWNAAGIQEQNVIEQYWDKQEQKEQREGYNYILDTNTVFLTERVMGKWQDKERKPDKLKETEPDEHVHDKQKLGLGGYNGVEENVWKEAEQEEGHKERAGQWMATRPPDERGWVLPRPLDFIEKLEKPKKWVVNLIQMMGQTQSMKGEQEFGDKLEVQMQANQLQRQLQLREQVPKEQGGMKAKEQQKRNHRQYLDVETVENSIENDKNKDLIWRKGQEGQELEYGIGPEEGQVDRREDTNEEMLQSNVTGDKLTNLLIKIIKHRHRRQARPVRTTGSGTRATRPGNSQTTAISTSTISTTSTTSTTRTTSTTSTNIIFTRPTRSTAPGQTSVGQPRRTKESIQPVRRTKAYTGTTSPTTMTTTTTAMSTTPPVLPRVTIGVGVLGGIIFSTFVVSASLLVARSWNRGLHRNVTIIEQNPPMYESSAKPPPARYHPPLRWQNDYKRDIVQQSQITIG